MGSAEVPEGGAARFALGEVWVASLRRGHPQEEVQTATTAYTGKCPASKMGFCAIDK